MSYFSKFRNLSVGTGAFNGTNYTSISTDGSAVFNGEATTWDDAPVEITSDPLGVNRAPVFKQFRNDGVSSGTQAVNFDAVGKYGTLAAYTNFTNDLQSSAWTIEAYIKPTSSSGADKVLFGQSGKIEFGTNASKTYFRANGGGRNTSSNTLNINAWNHVVWVYDGAVITMYINGVVSTSTYALSALTSITGNWLLGAITASTLPLLGAASQIIMYKVALTAAQISNRYNSGLPTDNLPTGITESTDVTFRFKCDEGNGTTLDNSATRGAGNDITLTGSPAWVAGPIGTTANWGVYLPAYEYSADEARTVRWEMPHGWKIGSAVKPHMHISANQIIPSGSTIVFRMEYICSSIGYVHNVGPINGGPIFPNTTVITGTLTVAQSGGVPAYSHILFTFPDVSTSGISGVSPVFVSTIRRDTANTFSGDVFEIQTLKIHYERDCDGSKDLYAK